jgi:hypothetical protein
MRPSLIAYCIAFAAGDVAARTDCSSTAWPGAVSHSQGQTQQQHQQFLRWVAPSASQRILTQQSLATFGFNFSLLAAREQRVDVVQCSPELQLSWI